MVYGPEGSTTGKPRHTFTAHLDDYKVTIPVNDIVKWSTSWTVSGAIVTDTYP
jgi:hypothetical protein